MAFIDIKKIVSTYYSKFSNWNSLASYEQKLIGESFLNNRTKICSSLKDFDDFVSFFYIYINPVVFEQSIVMMDGQHKREITLDFKLRTNDKDQITNNVKNLRNVCDIVGEIAYVKCGCKGNNFELEIELKNCIINVIPNSWLTQDYCNIPSIVDDFSQQRKDRDDEIKLQKMEEYRKMKVEEKRKNTKNAYIAISIIITMTLIYFLAPNMFIIICIVFIIIFLSNNF